MRDIRRGLEQRLEESKADRAQIERRIVHLNKKLELLRQVLVYERELWA